MGFENREIDLSTSSKSLYSHELEIIKKTLEHIHATNQNSQEYEAGAKELIEKIYDALEHHGITPMPLKDVWDNVKNQGLLIRRDDPERILDAVLGNKNINIRSNDDNYANASIDTEEGLRIALGEGLLGTEVNMAYGFDQDGLTVNEVKKSDSDLRKPSRFTHIRSIAGTIAPEHIKYLVIRVPAKFFPSEKLTDEEREMIDDGLQLPYIIRATKLYPPKEEALEEEIKDKLH